MSVLVLLDLFAAFDTIGLDIVLPTMASIIGDSLASGVFPSSYKCAIVAPLLKKHFIVPNDLKNYRSVSNLSFMFKLLEKVVVSQSMPHLNSVTVTAP